MKRKKINKVPAYAFGLDQAGQLANLAGTTLSATGNETLSTVGGTLSGAASGLAVGGPIGAAIGGVAGLATGLIGGAAKRRAEEKAKRVAAQRQTMNSAVANTAEIQAEANSENPLAYTFANGGVVPNSLAYVDDGETIRDPYGNVTQVPEQGQSTDQNLVSIPEQSTILSDRMKLKQLNGMTPSQYYKRKSSKVIEGTDEYSKNAAELNKRNNDSLYSNLLALQTQENYNKNRKQSMKSIPKYADGKSLFDYQLRKQWDPRRVVELDGSMDKLLDADPGYDKLPLSDKLNRVTKLNRLSDKAKYNLEDAGPISPLTPTLNNPPITSLTPQSYRINQSPTTTIKKLPTNYKNPITTPETPPPGESTGFDFGSIAALAPVAFNLAQSFKTPTLEEPVQNPYANQISSTMAGRRYNINPALREAARVRAIGNYNLSQSSPNTGASMAQRTQFAVGQYNNAADVFAQKQNVENQYASEYANTLNSLGQQNVQAQTYANQQNRAALAKQQEFAGTAATQFGQWGQTQQQMKNQYNMDELSFAALNKLLSQGYTTQEMQNLNRLVNQRTRGVF